MRAALRLCGAVMRSPSLVLFVCMFAAQSSLLVLSPILPDVAEDLDVSVAAAGQLRSVSGSVAVALALSMGRLVHRRGMRDLLVAGLGLLTLGAAVSSAAPSFAVLASAQAAIGAGLALAVSSAVAAAGEWGPRERARVLSWALAGQPAAWIVGMPVAGLVAEHSWRWAWIAPPLVASAFALAVVAIRPRDAPATAPGPDHPSVWRHPGVRGWAAGELCAYAGWAGTLVFAGALFVESYGISSTAVGLLLGTVAVAYLPGTFLARRWVDRSTRPLLIAGALASAAGVAVFGLVRPGVPVSAAVLAALAFVAGARTISGSALGLDIAPGDKLRVMSVRTAALQGGYLLGAALGGAALAAYGYAGLGIVLAVLFALAAVPHVAVVVAGPGHAEATAPRVGTAPDGSRSGRS